MITAAPVQLGLPMNTLDEGEARVYQFVFPFTPPSKNVYERWLPEWQTACKRKWVRHMKTRLDENMVPPVPRVGLSALLVFPEDNRRDPQNYAQTLWHFVPDALVRCGIIPDDSAGHIDFGPHHLGIRFGVDNRRLDKGRRTRTILALTMLVPQHTANPPRTVD